MKYMTYHEITCKKRTLLKKLNKTKKLFEEYKTLYLANEIERLKKEIEKL